MLPEQISLEVHFGNTVRSDRGVAADVRLAGASKFFQEMFALSGYALTSRLDHHASNGGAVGCSEFVLTRIACPEAALAHAIRPFETGAVPLFHPATDWLDPSAAYCNPKDGKECIPQCHQDSDCRVTGRSHATRRRKST